MLYQSDQHPTTRDRYNAILTAKTKVIKRNAPLSTQTCSDSREICIPGEIQRSIMYKPSFDWRGAFIQRDRCSICRWVRGMNWRKTTLFVIGPIDSLTA